VPHICDLALEDIFGLDYFKSIYNETKEYVAFYTNHHATLAAWRDHQPVIAEGGSSQNAAEQRRVYGLQLIKPGETRFASAHLVLARVLEVKAKLQQFVVSDRLDAVVSAMRCAARTKAELYKELILSSAYWKVVQQAVAVCSPIYNLLRMADGETAMTGKLHRFNFDVSVHLKGDHGVPVATSKKVKKIWEARWN
jgi:DNA-directed RNA polymerase subunit K/omega